jgi:hypothetical protein
VKKTKEKKKEILREGDRFYCPRFKEGGNDGENYEVAVLGYGDQLPQKSGA